MTSTCYICKNEEDNLASVRDTEVELLLLANYPEAVDLPENEPLLLCKKCYNMLENNGNNVEKNVNIPPSNPFFQSIISDSEAIPFETESIETIHEIFETSNNTVDNPMSQQIIDIEKLRIPGEIEKLLPNNRTCQNEVRNILAKAMPAAMKRKKIQEIVTNAETLQPNNSQQRGRSALDAYRKIMHNQNNSNRRSYKSGLNNSNSPSLSFSLESTPSSHDSIQAIASRIESLSDENSLVPKSPIINPGPSQGIRASFTSDISSNDERQIRSRSRSRSPRRNESISSNDSSSRIQDDGNIHSNSAAPRRIQIQPVHPNRIVSSKNIGG